MGDKWWEMARQEYLLVKRSAPGPSAIAELGQISFLR